jgi:putative transposase
VLGVSPSGFYASASRPPSRRAVQDQDLARRIRDVHAMSRGTYGAWRVHAELREEGVRVGRKRIARLMRAASLEGVSRRKWVPTTVRDEHGRPAPDLVQRRFRASGPNELWVADITEVATVAGRLYLAAVLDVWSRRVVGWSMDTTMKKELVEAALAMAVRQRQPRDVIHHSDQGGQYTSWSFGRRCRDAGIRLSMGSVGDAYDNALMESFFTTLHQSGVTPIREISRLCGFRNASSFSRAFGRATGMTPTDFRQSLDAKGPTEPGSRQPGDGRG